MLERLNLAVNDSDKEILVDAEIQKNQRMSMENVKVLVQNLANLYNKTKLALPDFSERPIFLDPSPDEKISANAIIVSSSYPYGSHRCLRAMWLEKKKGGEVRCVTVTSAFGGYWNKPHAGTFASGVGYFYKNADNHIGWAVFDPANKCYLGNGKYSVEPLDTFLDNYGSTISIPQMDALKQIKNKIIEKMGV